MTAIRVRTGLLLATVALALLAVPAGATDRSVDVKACRAHDTEKAFRAYVSAFNHGDFARLDQLFADWPAFRWYSSNVVGQRIRSAAFMRDTLLGYFRSRHRVGDKLRVEWFRFNHHSPQGQAHFSFGLRRVATDHRGGRPFDVVGKGAVGCVDGKLIVLSLGGPQSSH